MYPFVILLFPLNLKPHTHTQSSGTVSFEVKESLMLSDCFQLTSQGILLGVLRPQFYGICPLKVYMKSSPAKALTFMFLYFITSLPDWTVGCRVHRTALP